MMTDKKTILYIITQSEFGGAQRYVFDLASSLKDEFNVFVAFGEQGENGDLAKKLKDLNIDFFVIPNLERTISLKNDLKAFWQIRRLIKKIKPDILHLNSSKVSILGSLAAIFTRTKVIYTAHGWVFNEPIGKKRKKFYKRAEKLTAKFKDKIICVSKFDYQTAVKEKIFSENKLITIHNGIDKIDFFNKETARQRLQEYIQSSKFFIDENDFLIGSIGHLYKNKGYEYLINALKLIVDKNLSVKLMIIGEGEERQELENWIGQLNLQKNVILLGNIDNAAKLLPIFNVYVCSSVKEGLSYTLIEAMQAGVPIIATKVGGNSELITDTQNGLLVNSQNSEQIARAILQVMNDTESARKLGEKAREKANKEFDLESMVKKTREIYVLD